MTIKTVLLLLAIGGNQGKISHELPRKLPGGQFSPLTSLQGPHTPLGRQYPHPVLLQPAPHHLQPLNSPPHPAHLPEEQKNYEFGYAVKDDYGDDFSHKESRNGYMTSGEYRVALPDGRIQIVTYYADHDGYHADVKYEGVEHFPSPSAHPLQHSAPIAHPLPHNAPIAHPLPHGAPHVAHALPDHSPLYHPKSTLAPLSQYSPSPVVHHAPKPILHHEHTPKVHHTPTPVTHYAPTYNHPASPAYQHHPAPPTTPHHNVYRTGLKFSNPSVIVSKPEAKSIDITIVDDTPNVKLTDKEEIDLETTTATVVKHMPDINSVHAEKVSTKTSSKSLPQRASYKSGPYTPTPQPSIYHSTIKPVLHNGPAYQYHHSTTVAPPAYHGHHYGSPAPHAYGPHHPHTTPAPPVYGHPTTPTPPAYNPHHPTKHVYKPAPAYNPTKAPVVHHGPLHHVTTLAPEPLAHAALNNIPIYHSTIKPVIHHQAKPAVHHSVSKHVADDSLPAASSKSLPAVAVTKPDLYRSRIVVKGSSDTSPTALPHHMAMMMRDGNRYRPGPAIKLEDEPIIPELVSY